MKYLKIIVLTSIFSSAFIVIYFVSPIPKILTNKLVKTLPSISPTSKPTLYPTPIKKFIQFSFPISKPQDWIKYQAKCEPLKNHTDINYPKGWIPIEFPFVKSGGSSDFSECQVLFGYPVQPASPQYFATGELAEMRISTWIDKSRTAKQYVDDDKQTWVKFLNKSPTPIVEEITINNKVFYTEIYSENNPYGNPRYITDINHRFFDISTISKIQLPGYKHPDGIAIFDSSRDIINNEFLKRLRIY